MKKIKELQPELQREREKFQKAHLDVKVLEILKERQLQKYVNQQTRVEMQELDEFNQFRKKDKDF